MDPSPRKRKGAAVDRANFEHSARQCNDGASSTPLASHLYFQQQRKRTKEKRRDEESTSLDLHPTAASIAPPPRRGCLPNSPERGFKRKVGCIHASTRTGRKRKLEKYYDLGLELGRGKFGLVRICKKKATGENLACKTLPRKTEENVYKEVEIMQHLSGHPGVVTLQAVYEDAESLHLVMELCSGGRLIDEMSRNGCYSEHQAANLIKELMMVIKYCHELGVVHRDIKPENVLRTSSGQLKLADFGLSTRFAKGIYW
jgi:serine/threonine protein kinase